eukprot:GGOE01010275.1.p4 GENE.GGOE01010275.1~~GGOE01010275.1.p4  ORF type:complete len:101 (+),score=3.46 GGOE01010275.1:424-726(+)
MSPIATAHPSHPNCQNKTLPASHRSRRQEAVGQQQAGEERPRVVQSRPGCASRHGRPTNVRDPSSLSFLFSALRTSDERRGVATSVVSALHAESHGLFGP